MLLHFSPKKVVIFIFVVQRPGSLKNDHAPKNYFLWLFWKILFLSKKLLNEKYSKLQCLQKKLYWFLSQDAPLSLKQSCPPTILYCVAFKFVGNLSHFLQTEKKCSEISPKFSPIFPVSLQIFLKFLTIYYFLNNFFFFGGGMVSCFIHRWGILGNVTKDVTIFRVVEFVKWRSSSDLNFLHLWCGMKNPP